MIYAKHHLWAKLIFYSYIHYILRKDFSAMRIVDSTQKCRESAIDDIRSRSFSGRLW